MQPNPPKSSRKATSRPPHAKTHSTPAPNSSTNQTRHAFFSSLLGHNFYYLPVDMKGMP